METITKMSKEEFNNIILISGRSNTSLSEKIALHLGVKLTLVDFVDFHNTEIEVNIKESIRKKDVYIVQSGGCDEKHSVNDHIMEILLLADACKRSNATTVSVVMPLYPYARSDKKDKARGAIGAAMISRLLENSGVSRIITMDIHSGQIQGSFSKGFDNLYAIKLHCEYLKEHVFKGLTDEEIKSKFVLVTPDAGGLKRVLDFSNKLKIPHAAMDKYRDYNKVSTVNESILSCGNEAVNGKTCIVIDDMFDTFGTIDSAATTLSMHGAKNIIAMATHGIFSKDAVSKINNNNAITEVIVTNTLCQNKNTDKCNKIKVVDTSLLFAMVININHTGNGSVSELF